MRSRNCPSPRSSVRESGTATRLGCWGLRRQEGWMGGKRHAVRQHAVAIGVACALAATCVVSGFSRTFAQAQMTRVPQFENDRAVSWKSVIPPHTESTLHRHDRYRTLVAIAGGDLTVVGR